MTKGRQSYLYIKDRTK